ncbi:hypothetical protein Tco_0451525 [Tanacetum coccineum]
MSITKEQQQALDDAFVPREQRLRIGNCNYRLSTTFKPKEPTFQIALDVLSLTPFYQAFLISASFPAIYMHEFWATKFVDPPFEEEILAFIIKLGYSKDIKSLSDVKKNVDYVYLLWEDLVYQIENKVSKKNKDMYYPRFTKVIINHFMSKDQSIPIRNKVDWHMAKDDPILTTMRFIPKHETVQKYDAILPDTLTNQAMKESDAYKTYYDFATGKVIPKLKYVRRSTREKTDQAPKASPSKRLKATAKTQFHSSHVSGSGANEGTGVSPGVPDVPTYGSKDEQISWKSSDKDDDDEVSMSKDDDENANNEDDDDQDDDDEQTKSDNDGDDFVHPKFSTHDEEVRQDEEDKEEECSDLRVHTPSHFESTDDEAYDEVTQGDNVEEEKLDEEKKNEEEEVNEMYNDVNINLEGRDTEMTDALLANVQATQVIEDTHVIITTVTPEVQQQSSSVSSGFISKMFNPNPDTGIDSILNLNIESTSLVDVPVTTNDEIPPLSVTTLHPPPIPLIQPLVKSLEDDFSEFKQTNLFAEAVSSIPGIVDKYLANQMNEAVKVAVQLQLDRLRDEAKAKNYTFISFVFGIDDSNITIEEYIRLEEEKARKHGKVFNCQTATYGKIRVDDDLRDLSSMEAEFPAIVINDAFASQNTLQYKSQVITPINDEIDFRISFDESDDEDYTIICDKNSFSYKMISVNNLKTDSENDYEKVMPSIPSPEPVISCFDDLDFFKYFENEFSAIVYNDAQKSESDLLTGPILNPQHIDEFDLNDKTSLSEYDEEEQNILYFNDLFPFNVIGPDDLKSENDNDNNNIDIIQSFENNEITHGSNMLFGTSHDKNTKDFRTESFVVNLNVKIVIWIYYANGMLFYLIKNLCAPFGLPFDPKRYYKDGVCAIMLRRPRPLRHMAPLPPREQRHRFLRYEGLEYTDSDIADFESRLERIYNREIHRVQVIDFLGMPGLLRDGLFTRMAMEHRDKAGVVVFTSQAWRRLFDTRGPLIWELILEFLSTLRFGKVLLDLDAPDTIQFQLGGVRRRMSWRQFILALGLHTGEEMKSPGFARDSVLRLYHRMMAHSIARRSQAPEKVTMADFFYLRGLDVGSINIPYLLARYLRRFDAGRKSGAHISGGQFVGRMAQHFRLLTAKILRGLIVVTPELQMIDMAELVRLHICMQLDDTWALMAMGLERQPDVAAGAPADVEDACRLKEDVQGLRRDVGSLRRLVERSMIDQGTFSTWMITCMTQLIDASGLTYQAFVGPFKDDLLPVLPVTVNAEDWRG